MNSIKQFCRSLRQPGGGVLFTKYLGSLRKRKDWNSQRAMVSDPLVRQAFGEGADHFPRIWHRMLTSGRTSPQNIRRFAAIFGFSTGDELLQSFERWKRDSAKRPVRFEFIVDENGRYILPAGTELIGDNQTHYTIHQPITGDQFWGRSYKATDSRNGEWVFIKTLALDNSMDRGTLKERIGNLTTFLEREQTSLRGLMNVRGVAHFLDAGTVSLRLDRATDFHVPFLVMSFINAQPFTTAIPRAIDETPEQFNGIFDGPLFVEIARQMLRIVRDVHNTGLRHGDIRPENFMLDSKTVYLVDFGESGMASRKPSSKNARLTKYTAPERDLNADIILEATEDIYCLGCTLLWLASNKPPPYSCDKDMYEDRYRMRNYVEQHVHKELQRYDPGIVHIISECLHQRPGERVARADDILQMLDLFEGMMRHPRAETPPSVDREMSTLRTAIRRLEEKPLFSQMIYRDLVTVVQRATEMNSAKRAEIVGSRHDMIRSLLSFLSILSEGCSYITTTTPNFWSPKNLGINGRFLCANKMLAINGVRIRRLFVLTDDELANPSKELRAIINSQASVVRELRAAGIQTEDKAVDGPGYFVGVHQVSNEDARKIAIQEGYHIGIIRSGDETISLSFPDEGKGVIRKIYLWDVSGQSVSSERRDLEMWFKGAIPIVELADRFESKHGNEAPVGARRKRSPAKKKN